MEIFHDKRRNLTIYEKFLQFYWTPVLMALSGGEFFHDQRMKLTIYKRHPFDFIGIKS
jgi:hypothetical protein